MAAADEHDRVVGGHTIELGRCREALLLELGLVPVSVADDRVAGLCCFGSFSDNREQIIQRARVGKINAFSTTLVVEVIVGEPGRDECAVKVQDLGPGPAVSRQDRLAVANIHEFPAGHRESLGHGGIRIGGEYLAVIGDQVRGSRAHGTAAATNVPAAAAAQNFSSFIATLSPNYFNLEIVCLERVFVKRRFGLVKRR